VVAFAIAFLLVQCAQIGLVLAVAGARSGGDLSRLQEEAVRFAVSANGVMLLAATSASTFACIAIAAAWRPPGVVASLRLGPSRADGSAVAAAVLGMVGLSLALGTTTELLHPRSEGGTMAQIAHALSSLPPARLPLAVVAVAVAPGIAEEMFFRGLLQTRLVACWGTWRAIAACAIGFGLVHLDPVQGAVAAVSGLFLGWVAERLEGVRPTIAAHVANNALFVALAPWTSGPSVSHRAAPAMIGVGCLLVASSVAFLRSKHALRDSDAR
jgi:membrane protease YdiL (CAAX protease family)